MDIIKSIKKNTYNIPKIFNELLNNKNFILFDIETTGLNPNYNKIILIGVLYQQEENIVIKQFFCDHSSEEENLLKAFIDTFKDFNFYITYNGGNFDIPFLNKRFSKYNLNYHIDNYLNFDLYKVVRKNKNILNLNNCKLKTVEKFLGIDREDTINGAESVELFKKYEYTKDEKLKDKILLHNYEDILHLLPTLNILDYIGKNKIFAHFPKEFYIVNDAKVRIINYKVKKDFLEINGEFHGKLDKDIVFYNQSYNFCILKKDRQFKLKVPLLNINISDSENYSFINLNELNYTNYDLSKMNSKDKLKYLVKSQNEINDFNIYNFIKDFSLNILKQIDLNNIK